MNTPVELRCPGCQRRLRVRAELVGARIRCPQCANKFTVPANENGDLNSGAVAAANDAGQRIASLQTELQQTRAALEEAQHAAEENAQLKEGLQRALAALWEAQRAAEQCQQLQEQLRANRADADQLQAQIAELQERAVLVAGMEAELRFAQAAAQSLRQELDALKAQRSQSAELVQAQAADPDRLSESTKPAFPQGVEAAFAAAGRPAREADAQKSTSSPTDAESAAMLQQVSQLQQENATLRQWLMQFGIHVQ